MKALLIIGAFVVAACTGCRYSKGASEKKEGTKASLNIAYQYGLAYAPAVVCQEKKIIEKAYKDTTGRECEVVWHQMSSGPDINTGIASGSIDVGFMGIAPAITGVSKNIGYKIFTNLSGQRHGMMARGGGGISSLGDIVGTGRQIALVNIGSFQHLILAKALADNGYDAHALDSNIVAMKHPDGMNALVSGSIACHLTTNPYIFKESENKDLHEVPEVSAAWPVDNSFIVGVAAVRLYEGDRELYNALCSGIREAMSFCGNNVEGTAEITCKYDGNSFADEMLFLQKGSYSADTKGVLLLARFMADNGFIQGDMGSYGSLVFPNVSGD